MMDEGEHVEEAKNLLCQLSAYIPAEQNTHENEDADIRTVAKALLISHAKGYAEGVEASKKISVGIASTDELITVFAGLSTRRGEAYRAGWYNAMGSKNKAIESLLPSAPVVDASPSVGGESCVNCGSMEGKVRGETDPVCLTCSKYFEDMGRMAGLYRNKYTKQQPAPCKDADQ